MTRPVILGGLTRAELRRRWYRALERVPVAYCAWHRRYADRNVVDRGCGLLIEGYPSAGNTFAREALGYANPDLRIASHLHTVTHVRRALRLDVPVLILLRPPIDSVVSVLARFPARRSCVAAELDRYVRFYRGVLGVADRVAFACFDDTTSRLGDVARTVNRQLGTAFTPFDDGDPRAQRTVREKIDGWTDVVFGPDSEEHRALPSVKRQATANALRAEARSPAHTGVRVHAEALHRDLAAVARARFDELRTAGDGVAAGSAGS